MMALSVVMMANPSGWSRGIISFSKQPYFHIFEVMSRLAAGSVFVIYSDLILYPQLALFMGYLLIVVGIGLVIIGSKKHQQFAVWSAVKFQNLFRVAGGGSFCFGLFLIYISWINHMFL